MRSGNRLVMAGLLFVATATGCGGTKSPAKGPGGAVNVVEGDIFLDKADYTVPNGFIQVTVTNTGKMHHDLRIRNQALFLETAPGQKSSGTITLPKGTYELYCSISGHSSAKANLTVS